MHIKTVPASAGFHWIKLGFQTFWRQSLAWVLLFLPVMACQGLVPFIAWGGPALYLALQPLLTLLMIIAAAQVFAGQRLRPWALLRALQHDRARLRGLLGLCALYAGAGICLLVPVTLLSGGDLAGIVLGMEPMQRDPAAFLRGESPLQQSTAWVGCVLGLAFWSAPALVHWHGVAPLQALQLSIAGGRRNWRALLVYLLSGLGILIVLLLVIDLLWLLLAGPQSIDGLPFLALCFAASCTLTVPLCASLAFSFRDCFAAPQAAPATLAGTGLHAA